MADPLTVAGIIISVGILSAWSRGNDRRLPRIALVMAGAFALALAVLILRGDFFRYAPDSGDIDAGADTVP